MVQVLMDIAGETMAQLAASSAPKPVRAAPVEAPPEVTSAEDEDLQARLDAVRS